MSLPLKQKMCGKLVKPAAMTIQQQITNKQFKLDLFTEVLHAVNLQNSLVMIYYVIE